MKKPIDLAKLGEQDRENLRALLTNPGVPDGVRRFVVAALYRDEPDKVELAAHIHDTPAVEAFLSRCAGQVVRSMQVAQLTGCEPPAILWGFAGWVIRLVRLNLDLFPEGEMKRRMQAAERGDSLIQEAQEDCDCEVCRHRPRTYN